MKKSCFIVSDNIMENSINPKEDSIGGDDSCSSSAEKDLIETNKELDQLFGPGVEIKEIYFNGKSFLIHREDLFRLFSAIEEKKKNDMNQKKCYSGTYAKPSDFIRIGFDDPF